MRKYTAVATVAVSIVLGTVVALFMERGDIALGLVGLGSSLAVALSVHQRGSANKQNQTPE